MLYFVLVMIGLSANGFGQSTANLSPPVYEGKVKVIHRYVPMRDGVELAVRITRPDAEGKFPAIMEYNPYRRVKPPLPDYRDEYPPAVPYLAERGYVVVQYDVRGTGNSGGWSQDIYAADERRDAYEMVEWIAVQPWCNGNVGMLGKSYSGVVQWQVAVQNPPHLKTIIVRSANDSVYTEWTYPGGVLRPYMFDSYSPHMTAFNFAPPDPEIAGVRWSEIWQSRLDNNRPWGIGYISHPTEGPYFRVKLMDVAPDGTSKLVRYGGLSGTHRKSHFEPEAMAPGEVYELGVDVKEMSYVFAAGHRIRVAIASADIQNAWPTAQAAVNTLHRSRRYPSHILLPVIPEQRPKLPKPELVELPTADPKLLRKPLEYSITHDLVGNAVTVRLGRETKGVRGEGTERMVTRSRFTVSEENPADAVLAATSDYVIKRPGSEVEVKANEVTSSDEAAFHHVVDVEVTVNGARHFQKSWSVTVPRKLN